jgi:hypothetical protein
LKKRKKALTDSSRASFLLSRSLILKRPSSFSSINLERILLQETSIILLRRETLSASIHGSFRQEHPFIHCRSSFSLEKSFTIHLHQVALQDPLDSIFTQQISPLAFINFIGDRFPLFHPSSWK